MKPLLFDGMPLPAAAPLVEPGLSLADLLAALAARMTAEQRGAFLARMAAMDAQSGALSPATVTLGRA